MTAARVGILLGETRAPRAFVVQGPPSCHSAVSLDQTARVRIAGRHAYRAPQPIAAPIRGLRYGTRIWFLLPATQQRSQRRPQLAEIGRASCRERGCQYG